MASKSKKSTDRPSARSSEEFADDLKNKSSSSRFATYERIAGTGTPRDGDLIVEHRGEPDKDTPPGDA